VLVLQSDAPRSSGSLRVDDVQILQNPQLLVKILAEHYFWIINYYNISDDGSKAAVAWLRHTNQQSDADGNIEHLCKATFRPRGKGPS
jgi:hypothetical protein